MNSWMRSVWLIRKNWHFASYPFVNLFAPILLLLLLLLLCSLCACCWSWIICCIVVVNIDINRYLTWLMPLLLAAWSIAFAASVNACCVYHWTIIERSFQVEYWRILCVLYRCCKLCHIKQQIFWSVAVSWAKVTIIMVIIHDHVVVIVIVGFPSLYNAMCSVVGVSIGIVGLSAIWRVENEN